MLIICVYVSKCSNYKRIVFSRNPLTFILNHTIVKEIKHVKGVTTLSDAMQWKNQFCCWQFGCFIFNFLILRLNSSYTVMSALKVQKSSLEVLAEVLVTGCDRLRLTVLTLNCSERLGSYIDRRRKSWLCNRIEDRSFWGRFISTWSAVR